MKLAIDLPLGKIEQFCRKWKVEQLCVFGSILRDDFDPQKSDIDLLYAFAPDEQPGLDIVDMKEEIEGILGRSVDLVSKRAIERSSNPYRKKAVLEAHKVIYDQAA